MRLFRVVLHQLSSAPGLCLLIFSLLMVGRVSLPGTLMPLLRAQKTEKPPAPRKIVTQVAPDYPPDLKRAAIGGKVRLDIIVNPRGAVDYVQVAGGNPILAEAAARAVKRWKYAPAAAATNIRVNFTFDPTH